LKGRKKTIVIGLGNPLRGDDGFGSRVLDLLEKAAPHPNAEFKDVHTDLLGEIENFVNYDRVLLIDAILDPDKKLGQTGRILMLGEDAFLSWSESSHGVHQMSPLLAVKLFHSLHPSIQIEIILLGLLVDRIGSAPVYATEAAVKEAANAIQMILAV
jgi:hydrogenase maturation protease